MSVLVCDPNQDLLRSLAAINIFTLSAANWTATPDSMIIDPMNNAALRPSSSDASGVKGSPCNA
jgi:hypothetical protein